MEKGIYYIYNNNLYELPLIFDSKNTIYYLLAIKFIAPFSKENDLNFVKEWLDNNRTSKEMWEMPNLKPDGIVFPTSENWRRSDNKISDINTFINDVFSIL